MAEVHRRVLAGASGVARQALRGWSAHRSPQIAAALAYYIVFSVAPLLVLATALVALVYGGTGASAVIDLVSKSAGPTVSAALRQVLVEASRPRTDVSASLLGLVVLVAGAAGAFTSVQSALDQIWGVRPKPHRGIRGFVGDRLPAFLLLLVVGAVLFALGQALIAAYLSLVHVGSAFGAAGAIVALLLWLYYSGLVFLFGAELTRVIVLRKGSQVEPSPNAERLERCPPSGRPA